MNSCMLWWLNLAPIAKLQKLHPMPWVGGMKVVVLQTAPVVQACSERHLQKFFAQKNQGSSRAKELLLFQLCLISKWNTVMNMILHFSTYGDKGISIQWTMLQGFGCKRQEIKTSWRASVFLLYMVLLRHICVSFHCKSFFIYSQWLLHFITFPTPGVLSIVDNHSPIVWQKNLCLIKNSIQSFKTW